MIPRSPSLHIVTPSAHDLIVPDGLPSPADWGLPEQFREWRYGQWDAVQKIVEGAKTRFVGLCMPTGNGKSACAMAAAKISERRTVILTSTLGLTDQYLKAFGDNGFSHDIRGMSNYSCSEAAGLGLDPDTTVAQAPCRMGYRCGKRAEGCGYFDRYRAAQRAPIIHTTYQAWMYDSRKKEPLHQPPWGTVDPDVPRWPIVKMLVCDECFVAGTRIGGVPIEYIKVGDLVPSHDGRTEVRRQVTRLYKRRPHRLCRVMFSDKSSVVCTPSHPFLTRSGWLSPEMFEFIGSFVVTCSNAEATETLPDQDEVCSLPQKVHRLRPYNCALQVPSEQSRVLLQYEMRRESSPSSPLIHKDPLLFLRKANPAHGLESKRVSSASPSVLFTFLCNEVDISEGTQAQSLRGWQTENVAVASSLIHRSRISRAVCERLAAVEGEVPRNTRRQWEAAAYSAAKPCSGPRVANRSLGQNGGQTLGMPFGVQDRYRQRGTKDRYRGGWEQPSEQPSPAMRPEEGSTASYKRVDCVEILEPTSDGRFGGLCPDGFVYNLEVEDTHTYIAEGCVVHNCTEAADELERYVGIEISRYECLKAGVAWPGHLPIDGWIGWAKSVEKSMVGKINAIEVQIKASGGKFYSREYKLLKELHGKVVRLAGARADEGWVMDENLDQEQEYRSRRKKQEPEDSADAEVAVRSARFVPLEPARYAERCLWRGVEKVVLMSATLRPKECERLGIRSEELTFVEYPSSFPVERRPVYVVPSVMMNWRNEQDDEKMRWWLSRIDNIIEKRLERKGIIHAVSYARAALIKANSKFGRYMMIHNSHDRAEKIALFKESEAPSILVSPSLGTGHDFSDDLARWVIIVKLPFASVADKIVKARQDHDPEYQTFQVAQELVQFTGRAVRSESDFAENFIVDDAFGNWFFRKARRFFPKWWLDSLQFCQTIPDPISLDRKISQE